MKDLRFKSIIGYVALVVLCLTVLTGCGAEKGEYSDNIYAMIHFGGASGECTQLESMSGELYFYTDGTATLFFEGDEVISQKIDNFDEVIKEINRDELLNTEIESDDGVCDGYSLGIYFYDKQDSIAGYVGGYMPKNKNLNEAYQILVNSIDRDAFRVAINEAKAAYGAANNIE